MGRWIVGLVFLQLSLLGLLVGERTDGAITASDVSALALGSRLAPGDVFPSLVLYQSHVRRRIDVSTSTRPITLIAASCACESEQVGDWCQVAVKRGDRIIVIVTNTNPGDLAPWRGYTVKTAEIYAYRGRSLYNLLDLAPDTFPAQVRLLKGGVVLNVTAPNRYPRRPSSAPSGQNG